MDILRTVLTVVFILNCITITVIILLQEGKNAGLGTLSGSTETYWSRNKGRSMEGNIVKSTKFLVFVFFVLALVLNLSF